MTIAVGDIFIVNNEFEFQGDNNTYSWYLRADTVNDTQAVELDLIDFGNQRQSALLPFHDPTVEFRCVSHRQVWPNASLPYLNANSISGTATPGIDGPLPGQCSLVVTTYGDIAAPNKHNRGRDYWTGLQCEQQDDGKWDSGPLGPMQLYVLMYGAMGNTYVNGLSANEYSIGLFSMTQAKKTVPQNGNPPVDPTAVFFWPLEFVRARQLVRTQRRRAAQDPCEFVINGNVPT